MRVNSRFFGFQWSVAVLIATTLVCGGIASSALAQTTNKSTQTKSSTAKSSRVNVNSADVKTLETLPGVSSSLANKIVAGRPYKSLDDLKKVKGMSQSKIDGLKNHVTFGSTTASSKKSGSKEKTATASTEPTTTSTKTARNSTEESSTPLAATGSSSGTSASSKKAGPGKPININSASAEELEALPGIGPTKAQAIVDYRQQHGNFGSIEDIEKVKGIKQGEFSKIKDMIKVSE